MRPDPTPAEKRLWQKLKNQQIRGQKFRRQMPLGPCIADFYCPSARLVVELDGISYQPAQLLTHRRHPPRHADEGRHPRLSTDANCIVVDGGPTPAMTQEAAPASQWFGRLVSHMDSATGAGRDAWMQAVGIRIPRFSNLEVFRNLEGVLLSIQEVTGLTPPPNLGPLRGPSPQGEGQSPVPPGSSSTLPIVAPHV
jgi:very-short-patch-repair endonuclease